MSIYDRASLRVFALGQHVRFSEKFLDARPQTKKQFDGRIGVVDGYRQGAEDPIVLFKKEGRKKEVRLFEVDNDSLIPVDAPNTLDARSMDRSR